MNNEIREILQNDHETIPNPIVTSEYGCRRKDNMTAIKEGIADYPMAGILGGHFLIKFKDRKYGEQIRQKQIELFDSIIIKYFIVFIDENNDWEKYSLKFDGSLGQFDAETGANIEQILFFDTEEEAAKVLEEIINKINSKEIPKEENSIWYYLHQHPEEKDRYRVGVFDMNFYKNFFITL